MIGSILWTIAFIISSLAPTVRLFAGKGREVASKTKGHPKNTFSNDPKMSRVSQILGTQDARKFWAKMVKCREGPVDVSRKSV